MSSVLNKEDIPKAFLYPKTLLMPALFSTEVFTIMLSPRPHYVLLFLCLLCIFWLTAGPPFLSPVTSQLTADQSCLLTSGIQLLAFLFSLAPASQIFIHFLGWFVLFDLGFADCFTLKGELAYVLVLRIFISLLFKWT